MEYPWIGLIYLLTNAMKTEWQHRSSYFQAHLAVKIAIWQLLLSLRNISHLFIKTPQMNGTHILWLFLRCRCWILWVSGRRGGMLMFLLPSRTSAVGESTRHAMNVCGTWYRNYVREGGEQLRLLVPLEPLRLALWCNLVVNYQWHVQDGKYWKEDILCGTRQNKHTAFTES